jgi:hypothetical protein
MNNQTDDDSVSKERTNCPHCRAQTSINLPGNFAPVFVFCDVCKSKFIVQRTAESFLVMTEVDAPYDRHPDCIEIELGAGDEE